MAYKLIDLIEQASIPVPFDSIDAGEAWVWGDYVAMMQTKPITVAEKVMKMTDVPKAETPPIVYPFVLSVFYRKDRNPHGPSSRPIMVATLEIVDYAKAYRQMKRKGMDIKECDLPHDRSVVQGLFTGDGHFNFGHFEEILTRDSARQYFLNWLRKTLPVPGEPEKIGTLKDVCGNPKTGFELLESDTQNKGKGCAALLAGWVLLAVAAVTLMLQAVK